MKNYSEIFEGITNDPRYLKNLAWDKPRPGHSEGSVNAPALSDTDPEVRKGRLISSRGRTDSIRDLMITLLRWYNLIS